MDGSKEIARKLKLPLGYPLLCDHEGHILAKKSLEHHRWPSMWRSCWSVKDRSAVVSG